MLSLRNVANDPSTRLSLVESAGRTADVLTTDATSEATCNLRPVAASLNTHNVLYAIHC